MTQNDQGPAILWGMWIATIVPCPIIALRLHCKNVFRKRFGWDDIIALCSWVLLLICTALITTAVKKDLGKHTQEITSSTNITIALKLTYIGEFLAIIACVLSKTSFAVSLLRVVVDRWQVVLLWFIIFSMNSLMWLTAILTLTQCQPSAKLWDFQVKAKCWNPGIVTKFATVAGAYSGVMDLVLALQPWFIVWKLPMMVKEKIGVALAMSLGIFAFAIAMVKTSFLHDSSNHEDYTYYSSSILIWAAAETGATIIAASIPSLRGLVVEIRTSLSNSRGLELSHVYWFSDRMRNRHNKGIVDSDRSARNATPLFNAREDGSDVSIPGQVAAPRATRIYHTTYEQNRPQRENAQE
ncbi:hypothetical protein AOR_1_1188084 [Paecilomyces variotii No. 5]|uniref:Rhodopsin domain-containing protein n=1 Tax=Byssochlamys spectabilis (strain No. 5 / NBRC 109023) TaxID=1356009 RepID=V5I3Y9_BYSSN|nr:hypothetical protein AOR_1_1188084 [Paecilomyces variotii No. 5]